MTVRLSAFLIASLALLSGPGMTSATACPFCASVAQTLNEEMGSMDVVVIATLDQAPPQTPASNTISKARFKVEEIVKGTSDVDIGTPIETVYFGDGKPGDRFLVMAVDPPNLAWTTPLKLSANAQQYIRQLPKLPAEGPQRLQFFQKYLENPDDMLSRDAYDEFARAPYDDVKAIKDKMEHDQLVQWIKDPDVPASRRRLYFVMLGVCGGADDFDFLEQLIKSDDRQDKAGLDSLIACYLTLKGADGLPLINDLYLKKKKADYADTYAAIMAIRFHGTEADIIPRKQLLSSLHLMLDRPELADLVIPDLARWNDWSQMDKLVELFKNADDKTSWVRVPVVNYLRACPLPEAKKHMAALEKIDPAAVQRAKTFFPFGGAANSESGK